MALLFADTKKHKLLYDIYSAQQNSYSLNRGRKHQWVRSNSRM